MAGMREEGREQRKTVGQEGVGVDRGGGRVEADGEIRG